MSIRELNKFLDALHQMGVFLLVFTGGEPFLNVRLEWLLQCSREKGFVIEIFSNLQHIPSWFWRLDPSLAMIGRVQTSIYSSDHVVHDSITTVSGSLTRSLKNLMRLKERGFYVEVATPLMSLNFRTWVDTATYFKKVGIKQDFSWPIVGKYYSHNTEPTSLNISPEQFREFVDENPNFLIKTQLGCLRDPICELGRSLFSVSANGDVFPCSQFPYSVGNITQASVHAIYDSREMQRFRDIKCVDTGLSEAYNYCLGENYVETGNPLTQPQFLTVSITTALREKGGKS
jgi:MoaA/NifB/PqqE/SkfB family radical SAM enzyme